MTDTEKRPDEQDAEAALVAAAAADADEADASDADEAEAEAEAEELDQADDATVELDNADAVASVLDATAAEDEVADDDAADVDDDSVDADEGEALEASDDDDEDDDDEGELEASDDDDDDAADGDDDGEEGEGKKKKRKRKKAEAEPPPVWLDTVLESMILCSTEPLSPQRVRDVLRQEGEKVEAKVIRQAMKDLVEKYSDEERPLAKGFQLVETGGGFTFRTVGISGRFLRRFFEAKPQRLSKAALETLSIIAYRQPVTRPQVDDIRGVDCSGAIKNLLDRGLIRVLGKADEVGRPLIYGTTKTFLEFFQLKSLSDMPTLREYHELTGDGEVKPREDTELIGGPVQVMDLFDPGGSGDLVSSDTEEESRKALQALEVALGEATEVGKTAERVADGDFEGMEDAIDARARVAKAMVDFDTSQEGDAVEGDDDAEGAAVEAADDESGDDEIEAAGDDDADGDELEAAGDESGDDEIEDDVEAAGDDVDADDVEAAGDDSSDDDVEAADEDTASHGDEHEAASDDVDAQDDAEPVDEDTVVMAAAPNAEADAPVDEPAGDEPAGDEPVGDEPMGDDPIGEDTVVMQAAPVDEAAPAAGDEPEVEAAGEEPAAEVSDQDSEASDEDAADKERTEGVD